MKKNRCTIGIIGLGKFGTLSAAILSQHANVEAYHYKDNEEIRSRARKVGAKLVDLKKVMENDVVILTVPIAKTKEMIKKIAPLAQKDTLVIDACSVKVFPCRWLEKYIPKKTQIMGTHPMFGPVTTKFNLDEKYWELENKQVVLCPLRIKKENLENIIKFLKSLGLIVIVTTPEDHDKQNAKTLSFVHFVGRSFTKAGIGQQKIFTPGYADLLKIIPHTNDDKWQLFCDMNNFNPYSEKVREKFKKAGEELIEGLVKSKSIDDFEFNRNMIDKIDKEILDLLERRFKYVKQIGKIKKKNGLKIVDKKREKEIINKKIKQSKLDEEFIKKLYRLIFNEAYRKQEENKKIREIR